MKDFNEIMLIVAQPFIAVMWAVLRHSPLEGFLAFSLLFVLDCWINRIALALKERKQS